jgi:predicted  nucleic acid-binding Zn-ribbon protein
MALLTAAQRAAIQARIDTATAQLAIANATYTTLLGQDTEEYKFNSGEGAQWAVKRKLSEVEKQITRLEARIDALNRQLSDTGLVNITLRRS